MRTDQPPAAPGRLPAGPTRSALRRAVSTARAVRSAVAAPPYAPPGHFYSPQTSGLDRARALRLAGGDVAGLGLGVDLGAGRQLTLAAEMGPVLAEPLPGPRYRPANPMFGPADAAIYRAMLRKLRPARIVEIGSGYSTAVALDETDGPGGLEELRLTCVEPYPARLLGLLKPRDSGRVTIVRAAVQDAGFDVFGQLAPGDVLFIDSTHVVKAGSDVVWLFLRMLPGLPPGVIVHVHDIFWPFEYPSAWLAERRDWTEVYLLHAFLAGNSSWEIMFFGSWLWCEHPALVPLALAAEQPGSIWLRKVR